MKRVTERERERESERGERKRKERRVRNEMRQDVIGRFKKEAEDYVQKGRDEEGN